MKKHAMILVAACVSSALSASGCLSWAPGWKDVKDATARENTAALLARARGEIARADDREKLAILIGTYERVLESDPWNYEALWSLGRYWILMGVAYTPEVKEKKECYIKALRYCERGMYTNDVFTKRVEGGAPVWEACDSLTAREIEAMYYWYASLGWYYLECMNPMEKLFNMPLASRNREMVDCMMEIDPTWGGGHPLSAVAGYYAALPFLLGGDLDKAARYFEMADQAGAGWLYVRFSRARLLHARTGDREAYRKDLEWVVAQDPHRAKSPYPWNVYFQREARNMLARDGVRGR